MRILRDDPATAHIPVLALSANAIPRDIEAAWRRDSSAISPSHQVNEFMEALDVALEHAENG